MHVSSASDTSTGVALTVSSSSAPHQLSEQQRPTCQRTSADEVTARADTVLCEEQWAWVRELLETVSDRETLDAAKGFFLHLLEATTAEAVDAVLIDLDAWRANIDAAGKRSRATSSSSRQLAEVSRTLFLLGADKQIDLMQQP